MVKPYQVKNDCHNYVKLQKNDFVFSEEEIAVFYEDYYNKVLTEEEAKNIVQITEGWAIAVNLVAMHMIEI